MKYLIIYKFLGYGNENDIREDSTILTLTEEEINEKYITARININKGIQVHYIANIINIPI